MDIIKHKHFLEKLTKPLAIVDIESTGTSITKDRVCSIAIKKIFWDGTEDNKYMLINPEMHIPAEATAVHGITDEMIAQATVGTQQGAARFSQVAVSIFNYIQDSVLGHYNGDRFDIPMLAEEFARCNIQFPLSGQPSLDVMTIFHEKEKRDLAAAKVFYTGEEMSNAHQADADVQATFDVLLGQVDMYPDLKEMNIEQIAEFTRKKDRVDLAGKLKRTDDNIIVFSFGKYFEQPVATIFQKDHSYYNFLMGEKFEAPIDTRNWFTKIFNHVNNIK